MNEAPAYPKGVTSHLIRYFIRSKQLNINTITSQYFNFSRTYFTKEIINILLSFCSQNDISLVNMVATKSQRQIRENMAKHFTACKI